MYTSTKSHTMFERNIKSANFLLGALIFFWMSWGLLSVYSGGDQEHYARLYKALMVAEFSEVMYWSKSLVSGAEPVAAYALWIGAKSGISKEVYVSLLNLCLLLGLLALLKKHGASTLFKFLLITNFYLLVLLTAAERLKIGYLFLIYSALTPKKWFSFCLALLSVGGHLSIILHVASILTVKIASFIMSIFATLTIRATTVQNAIFVAMCSLLVLIFFTDAIITKASSYMTADFKYVELAQFSILSSIALVVCVNRTNMIVALLPLGCATLMLGGDRLNMISVIAVLYLLTKEGRLEHPLVIALMCYLSFKSIPFLINIFEHGNGFHRFAPGSAAQF